MRSVRRLGLEVVSPAMWTRDRLADAVCATQVEDERRLVHHDHVAELAHKLQNNKATKI